MQYKTRGTCSTMINLTLDENHVIQDVHFTGGCNGNLQGISKLVIDQRVYRFRHLGLRRKWLVR